MNILSRLKKWWEDKNKVDPEAMVPFEMTIDGKTTVSEITAREADDISEVFFGERLNETEKKK